MSVPPTESSDAPQVAMETDPPVSFFEERNAEIRKLIELSVIIYNHVYEVDPCKTPENIDLDRSDAVAGILATVFTYMRKKANENQKAASEAYGGYTVTQNSKNLTVKEIAGHYEQKNLPFDFKIATPLMNLFTAFKLSLDEVRLGMTKVTGRRQGNSNINPTENITSYGLGNVHIPLLQGITFQPERRTALLEGLGPLTLALLLLNDKKYPDKIEKAFKKSIEMLPMAEQIATCLKMNDKSTVRGLMRELGDLLLMTSHRATRRIHFPLEALVVALKPNNINLLNFNGTNGILFYNNFLSNGFWKIKTKADPTIIRQVIFHAMFGTNIEDLGIIAQITDVPNWINRKQADIFFTQRNSQIQKTFAPIKFHYISKLLKANPTKMLGTVQPMMINGIVFAGNRKRKYTSAFSEYLQTGRNSVSYGSDPNSLAYALTTMRQDIMKNVPEEKRLAAGTTSWFKYNSVTRKLEEVDIVLEESGSYFYT